MNKPQSVTELFDFIKNESVEFINLQFSDMMGIAKSVTIPKGKLPEVMESGLWFDGSSVEGFTRIFESDMLLVPDIQSYSVIPWLMNPAGNTARLICDVYNPDGTPYEADPRYILKKVLKEAEDMGFVYHTGPELEFFLFKKENGNLKTAAGGAIETHDRGQYFDLVMDLGFDVRREMMLSLEKMGIEVEASHHEVAPGQHEIDFKYGEALRTADKVMTLKAALKAVAAKYGLQATFMPKPITGINGNGMHVHQSLFSLDRKTNLFFSDSDKYKLSDLAYSFLAGQIKYVKEISAILNPIVNSYKRLVPGYEAATYICWATQNRSALIRVPRFSKGRSKSVRLEIRNPDPSANPYLAFAVLLKAGLEGIKQGLTPPPPVEEDVFEFDEQHLEKKGIDVLPRTLWDSVQEIKGSELARATLGNDLLTKYVRAKLKEWEQYSLRVTNWEIGQYLEVY